jgi:hypothetical protein
MLRSSDAATTRLKHHHHPRTDRTRLCSRDGSFRNESFQVNDSLQGVVNDQLTEEEGIIHLGTICRTVPLLAS